MKSPEERALVRKAIKQSGIDKSVANRSEVVWMNHPNPILSSYAQIVIPFSSKLSKNAVWSFSGRGNVYIKPEIKATREEIEILLRQASRGITWYEGKVWLDIFVEKPDHRSDPINLIDSIADAVKKVIGVDDRWFAIRRLDWAIVKSNPVVRVGVGQEVTEHHVICHHCGEAKPLDQFGKDARSKFGRGSACKACTRVKSARVGAI